MIHSHDIKASCDVSWAITDLNGEDGRRIHTPMPPARNKVSLTMRLPSVVKISFQKKGAGPGMPGAAMIAKESGAIEQL